MAKQMTERTLLTAGGNHNRQTFSLKAPGARRVMLLGDFTQWERSPIEMRRGSAGLWQTEVELARGPHQYRFLVDGQWQDDPECPQRVPNGLGSQNCVCQVS